MTRPDFKPRVLRLISPSVVESALAVIRNAPVDAERPLELVIREEKKTRKPDQNSAMWSGPLHDIAEQAWVSGRQFSAEVWHHFYKVEYLPEADDPDIALLAKDGYRKWDFDPNGERVLVGSTKDLTVRGFALYLQQVEAHGANLGVQFHASPNAQSRR